MNCGLSISEHHGFETALKRRRDFTGSLHRMFVIISGLSERFGGGVSAISSVDYFNAFCSPQRVIYNVLLDLEFM